MHYLGLIGITFFESKQLSEEAKKEKHNSKQSSQTE
jgi:hypothetical protein